MADLLRFPHRVVELPVKTLDDLAREHGVEAQHKPDPIEQLRARRPTVRDHLESAAHDPGFMFFLGGFVGVTITCVSAIVAAGVLK